MSKVQRFWSHEARNIRCVREADYDALHAEAEALRVALLGIASANPAERGIEWAKSYASEGLKGSGSELYARWLDTFKEAEALRAENSGLSERHDVLSLAFNEMAGELEAARGLLSDIRSACNMREMPSEHAISDISDRIDALLTATPAPEVRQQAQGERQDALRKRFSQIEDEVAMGKHTAMSVFTQMRTAALYTTPQPAPDVSALVEALEAVHERFGPCRGEFIFSKRHALDKVAAALATYRKQAGQ